MTKFGDDGHERRSRYMITGIDSTSNLLCLREKWHIQLNHLLVPVPTWLDNRGRTVLINCSMTQLENTGGRKR